MLIVLTVLILFVGIGLLLFGDWCDYLPGDRENKIFYFLCTKGGWFFNIGLMTTILSALALVVMLIILLGCHCGVDAKIDQYAERYNALIYKVESGACRDDFGLLNKEVIDEIQAWNEDVVYGKRMRHDFWLGVFWPDIYDQFETIDYNMYRKD